MKPAHLLLTGILMVWSLAMSVIAQVPDLHFRRIGVAEGLPNMSVDALHQDRFGFIWIGTWDGLCRYDGQQFEVFRTVPGDPESLIFNEIKGFAETDDSTLWVSTYGGITMWDQTQGRFFQTYPDGTRFPDHPKLAHHIVVDQSGRLMIGSHRGNHVVQFEDRSTSTAVINRDQAPNESPIFLLPDQAGTWLGDDRGLFLIRPGSLEAKPAREYDPILQTLDNRGVRCLLADKAGVIWIGTDEGLWGYSPLSGTLEQIKDDQQRPLPPVTSLAVGLDGQLWIGTREGLYCRQHLSRSLSHFTHDPNVPHSLSQDHIKSLMVDRSGSLWVGTARGGLNQANLRTPSPFNVFSQSFFQQPMHELVVFSFEEGSGESDMWVGTNHGLYLVDHAGQKILREYHAPQQLAGETVMSLHRVDQKTLLVSTRPGGLSLLDTRSGVFRRLPNPADSPLADIAFYRAVRGWRGDSLLVAGNLAAWLLDVGTGTWQKLQHGYCWDVIPEDSCRFFVAENAVYFLDLCTDSLLMDRWNATDHDRKRAITYLYRDSTHLWLGTYGMGLLRVNLSDWSFRRWSRQDGLPSDYVFGILEDEQNRLWLSTTEGLARLNKTTGDLLTFGVDDGLMDNEFATNSAFRAADGQLFFGGNNGFISFEPDQVEVRQSQFRPPLYITSLRLSGNPLDLDSTAWLKQRIEFPAYRQQHLEIGFAGLDYSRPGNLQYQFRLLGWKQEWTTPGPRTNAQYTNLPPGKYTFQVKCTNGDGIWNAAPASLEIIISPLWYQTWWVRIAGPASGVLLILVATFMRFRQSRRREREQLFQRIATIRQEALSAQMDHHFTFNALNSIQRFITDNNKEASLYYIARFGKLIRRFLDQARKHEHPIEDEITTLDLYLSLESLRCQQAFTYRFEVDPDIDPFNTDIPTSLLQPLVENAIWHGLVARGDKDGQLTIRFRPSAMHLLLEVEDNGVGRDHAAQNKGLHQSKAMTIIRERLEALEVLNGQQYAITFEDFAPGTAFPGTRVTIFLPLPDLTSL